MARTITAGKYTIAYTDDQLTITERDAFVCGQWMATDTTSRYHHLSDSIADYTDRELITDALFGQWTFGYPYIGIMDGAMLCVDCAIDALVAQSEDPDTYDPERDAISVTVLQESPPAGEYCEGGCEISAPYCEDCGSPDHPLMMSDSGYHAVCRDCLAAQLITGKASRKYVTQTWNGTPHVEYTAESNGRYTYVRS